MKYISNTQIETAKCLLRYKKKYIDKDVDFSSPAMTVGKLAHEIIRKYVEECKKSGSEGDYELMKRLIDEVTGEEKISTEMFADISDICLGFGERGVDWDHVLELERRFEIDMGEYMYVGVIDRVDVDYMEGRTVLKIIDYKTQRNVMSADEVARNLQLRIYRYFSVNHLYPGFDYVNMGINHVRYGFTRWAGDHVPVGELKTDFDTVKSLIEREYKRIKEAGVYLPERGPWCWEYDGCAVMKEGKCPLWEMEEVERMRRMKEIEDKVRLLRKIEFEAKTIKKTIKEELGENTIEVDGQMVGYEYKRYMNYDLAGTIKLLQEYGVSISGLTLPKTSFEKLIRDRVMPDSFFEKLEKYKNENIRKTFIY